MFAAPTKAKKSFGLRKVVANDVPEGRIVHSFDDGSYEIAGEHRNYLVDVDGSVHPIN